MRRVGWAALLAAALAAACSPGPVPSPSPSSPKPACLLTDATDERANANGALAAVGLERARAELGVAAQHTEVIDAEQADAAAQAAGGQCRQVIAIGPLAAASAQEVASRHPEVFFATAAGSPSREEPAGTRANVQAMTFNLEPGAYLAGYLAAGTSRTGLVATFGAAEDPAITELMSAFAAGVGAYNDERDGRVTLLGWTEGTEGSGRGVYASAKNRDKDAERLTVGFIEQGADVIAPVGEEIADGALAAIVRHDDVLAIGSGTDWYEAYPRAHAHQLTSVLARYDTAVFEVLRVAATGEAGAGEYVGTLANDGVSLAPFRDAQAHVPQELRAAIEDLASKLPNAIAAG